MARRSKINPGLGHTQQHSRLDGRAVDITGTLRAPWFPYDGQIMKYDVELHAIAQSLFIGSLLYSFVIDILCMYPKISSIYRRHHQAIFYTLKLFDEKIKKGQLSILLTYGVKWRQLPMVNIFWLYPTSNMTLRQVTC